MSIAHCPPSTVHRPRPPATGHRPPPTAPYPTAPSWLTAHLSQPTAASSTTHRPPSQRSGLTSSDGRNGRSQATPLQIVDSGWLKIWTKTSRGHFAGRGLATCPVVPFPLLCPEKMERSVPTPPHVDPCDLGNTTPVFGTVFVPGCYTASATCSITTCFINSLAASPPLTTSGAAAASLGSGEIRGWGFHGPGARDRVGTLSQNSLSIFRSMSTPPPTTCRRFSVGAALRAVELSCEQVDAPMGRLAPHQERDNPVRRTAAPGRGAASETV